MSAPIPHFWQETDYHCGPAVLQMILASEGIKKPQRQLARQAKTSARDGTSQQAMVRVLREYGLRVRARQHGTLDNLHEALALQRNIIVNYVEPVDHVGHYAIVHGFLNGNIILQDPLLGRRLTMPVDAFRRRWRSGDGTMQRWFATIH